MALILIVGCLIIGPLSFIFHCVFPASFILLASGAASEPETSFFSRLPKTWKRTAIVACVTLLLTLSYLWVRVFDEESVVYPGCAGVVVGLGAAFYLGRRSWATLLRMSAVLGFFHFFVFYAIYGDRVELMGGMMWLTLLPLAIASLLLGVFWNQSGDGREVQPEPSNTAKKVRWFAEFFLGEGALIFPIVSILRKWFRIVRR